MSYEPLQRRLAKLEHGRGGDAECVLHFPDNSTRAVSFRKPLELFCATCARLSHTLAQRHEHEPDIEPRPESRYDKLIELFGRADGIQTDNRFLFVIQDLCRQAIEEEQKPPEAPEAPKKSQ
jgi:hypothetical protein